MLNQILDNYPEDSFLIVDGFDNAIIGVDETTMKLIYSVKKCIEILTQYISEEDAIEYFYINIMGAYVGDKTPIWCTDTYQLDISK